MWLLLHMSTSVCTVTYMSTSHENPFEPLVDIDQLRQSIEYFSKREKAFREQADLERIRLRDCVRRAVQSGMSELEASKLSGVTRGTVRTWIGK